jgi:hypothetical protein
MKGIIFNLFEEFLVANLGSEAYEDLLDATPLQTRDPFVGPGSYPDADLLALAAAAAERSGIPVETGIRDFGRFCIPALERRFPAFFDVPDAKTFLQSLERVHHVEVRKLYDDAIFPRFRCEDPGPDRLVMRYESSRRLCALAEGLIEGVAERFGVRVAIDHAACMHRGDPACVLDLAFSPEVRP